MTLLRQIAVRFASAALVAGLAMSGSASAQSARTWVSGVGNDVNACDRTAPCKTLQGALGKTAANGEINCLDSGNFGAVTIAKSVVIDCKGALDASAGAIAINVPNGQVVLRNFAIDGEGTALTGISIAQAGSVHIEDVAVRGHVMSGIELVPSAAPASGTSQLTLVRVVSSGNGQHGVLVAPTAGKASAAVSGSTFSANALTGIRVNDNGFAILTNTFLTANLRHGAAGVSTGGTVTIFLDRVVTASNFSGGVLASGALATVYLSGVTAALNLSGGLYPAIDGGSYVSFGDNRDAFNLGGVGTATSHAQF